LFISSAADMSLILMHLHLMPDVVQAEISPEGGAARTGLVTVVSTSNRRHAAGTAAAHVISSSMTNHQTPAWLPSCLWWMYFTPPSH
jgi:hypothetical protein